MYFLYKRATIGELELLVKTRIEVLRAANRLDSSVGLQEVEEHTRRYYKESLQNGQHIALLVWDSNTVVGTGGVSFYQVMPTYRNPSGKKAYIMNMYTAPAYRRKGIALHTLDLLMQEVSKRGIAAISLEATEMGRPLYERYGFQTMKHEMVWPLQKE